MRRASSRPCFSTRPQLHWPGEPFSPTTMWLAMSWYATTAKLINPARKTPERKCLMSAFVVAKTHIDAMVRLAIVYSPRSAIVYGAFGEVRLHPDEVGRDLLDENVRSVRHRYPGDERLPGPNDA